MHRATRRLPLVVAASVAIASLAACGGGDGTFRATQPAQAQPEQAVGGLDAASSTEPAAAEAADAAGDVPPPTDPPAAAEPPAVVAPPPPLSQVQGVRAKLELIPGTESLDLLTSIATRPDGTLYFGQQDGRVSKLAPDGSITKVLDITNEVEPYQAGSERGFLGLAVSPANDRLFMYFTDNNMDSHLRSYAIDAAGNIDPTTRRDVLFVDQPGLGHKGGGIVFLPDGSLLLALGDGGGSRGRDAQDYTKVLGGIIRVIPNPEGHGYTIPADNPYVGNSNGWPQEIWAKGLRNPWGFHLDHATGDLWLGDVGESSWEEVNTFPSSSGGYNFGWYYIEGNEVQHDGAPSDARAPHFAYPHNAGAADVGAVGPAVIGGFPYRGTTFPDLDGAYLFADMTGAIYVLAEGRAHRLTAHRAVITAWGRDVNGEPIMLSQRTGVYRLVPDN